MPNTLCQLIYVSAARTGLTRDTLDAILNVSARENPAHGITGMLLYDRGSFLQVLEGPNRSISTLFENIRRDSRHDNVMHMLTLPVSNRDFPDWAMAYPGLTVEDLGTHPALSDFFIRKRQGFAQMDHGLAQTVVMGFRSGLFHMTQTGRFPSLPEGKP